MPSAEVGVAVGREWQERDGGDVRRVGGAGVRPDGVVLHGEQPVPEGLQHEGVGEVRVREA